MKKFTATLDKNIVTIKNNRTNQTKNFNVRNFIYGQGMYGEDTEMYPNYIHHEIWKQVRRDRG